MNYARYSEIKAGDKVTLDDRFSCHQAGDTIIEDHGGLCFMCSHGMHYLDGQLEFNSEGDDTLLGIYKK